MRWLVWSPQLLAGCVLVVTVVSANLPYPLLEGDDARFAGAYGVGVAVWYSVFLGLTSLIALLVAHTALQPLTTRAAIAAALTGLLVAGTATRSSSGFISIRGDGVIVAGPGVLAVLGAGRLRFRSEAARDARRGDPASWGRWGSGSRRVVAAWFGPGERFLVAVTDAVPDRPRYGAAVALTKDGELDRAFSRNVGGDLGGWPVVAGGRIVVARSAPLGVRVLRADGHEDAAATAALASALSGAGATELDVHAIDAAGDVVLAKLGDGRLAAIDVSRDPPSIRASGAPPAGLERHVAMGGRLVSARVGGDDAPSLASLERERLATSDGTPLALRLPRELADLPATRAEVTGLFPWSETSVLVGVRASWGTRVREVLVLGGEPGSGDPLLAVETNEPATRAVRLEDGAVAVEDGNHRISFLPGTGIHLLPGATYDDVVSRPRFERSGDRSSWVFPGRAVGVSRRGEIFTCRDGVPIVLYRDGHIGRFDPPLPFGC